MTRIGVLGLGNMGSIMASRLLAAGFDVWVGNRTAARAERLVGAGAHWSESGDAIADQVELLITMVADDDALLAVTTGESGILARRHPGLVYADMSTVSPDASAAVADAAERAGVRYLRAPVSGSTTVAEAGALGILASGPQDALDEFDQAFTAIGKRVFYLGQDDEARIMKLALNMLVAQTVVGLSEALVLGERAGLDWQTMLDVFSDSAVASPLVQYKASSLSKHDFEAAFTTSMMTKDLDVALAIGRRTGAVMPTTALTQELLRAACGLGWGDQDFSAAVLMFERLAGDQLTNDR
ncbi:NAD(P)-dependent oxidoreductase [Microlunatus sp. Gsoil 973]|uniref:NAD(P)-dependent oxidoreductase n=1 Tax=Microlunatus sp. Gsoil 973 TaxID=2672569 RepID=UPI0012B4FD13|nr:NAD(P)-dependent oxidoreductase [Microlunatus sp. Gsoil 973]QGN31590.1 NAD-binding protein [Microlunatus sp. Gsoil 973]